MKDIPYNLPVRVRYPRYNIGTLTGDVTIAYADERNNSILKREAGKGKHSFKDIKSKHHNSKLSPLAEEITQ